ncbi:MAG TPA: SDR family NAD(P)-dependent oxidoreductase, partial [Gemmata sp.]|nr:SDR family NAD(P)-dependent oxidoreductase [Gemmata sp.]
MRVAGSRVIVTGAAQGLGLAIATACSRAGASVILADINADALSEAVGKLKAAGCAATGHILDVTCREQIAEVRERILAENGPIDILVNNAGVAFGGPFHTVPLDRHLATVNVNLAGVLAMTHAFLPDLISRPAGHIVNIASAAAVVAMPLGTTYAATKWAVL